MLFDLPEEDKSQSFTCDFIIGTYLLEMTFNICHLSTNIARVFNIHEPSSVTLWRRRCTSQTAILCFNKRKLCN